MKYLELILVWLVVVIILPFKIMYRVPLLLNWYLNQMIVELKELEKEMYETELKELEK